METSPPLPIVEAKETIMRDVWCWALKMNIAWAIPSCTLNLLLALN